MMKLLRANRMRLKKEKLFWICIAAMALYAPLLCIIGYHNARTNGGIISFDNMFFCGFGLVGFAPLPGILMAAFCSIFIGKEFSNGTIRNKIIVGRTKTQIYLVLFLTCAAVGVLMEISYMVGVFAVGIPLFGFFTIQTATVLALALDGTLMMIAYAAIFTLISILIQNQSTSAILSLIGVFMVMLVSISFMARLVEPEFISAIVIIDGKEVLKDNVPNSSYLKGTARAVCQFIVDFFPTGQSLQISDMTAPHVGWMGVYSAIIIGITNIVGMFFFRRRDLK